MQGAWLQEMAGTAQVLLLSFLPTAAGTLVATWLVWYVGRIAHSPKHSMSGCGCGVGLAMRNAFVAGVVHRAADNDVVSSLHWVVCARMTSLQMAPRVPRQGPTGMWTNDMMR